MGVRFTDEDVWPTQGQLAENYDTIQENISMHISNIYKDGELDQERIYKKFLLVRQKGRRNVQRNIDHYSLDMIIALGYRVQSKWLHVSVAGLPSDSTSIIRRAL